MSRCSWSLLSCQPLLASLLLGTALCSSACGHAPPPTRSGPAPTLAGLKATVEWVKQDCQDEPRLAFVRSEHRIYPVDVYAVFACQQILRVYCSKFGGSNWFCMDELEMSTIEWATF